MKKKKITRRAVAGHLGIAGGASLLLPALARAATITPSQVEGPFHPIEEQADTDIDLTIIEGHAERAEGDVILVEGRVLDSEGRPIHNALVDVWQANHHGRYAHEGDPNTAPLDPNFQGWGLMKSAEDGHYGFKTIKPGAYPLKFLGYEGWRCQHIHFKVSHADYADLTTQMYFKGDPLIEQDEEIAKAPADQQHLLIADSTTDEATGLPKYRFDIYLDA